MLIGGVPVTTATNSSAGVGPVATRAGGRWTIGGLGAGRLLCVQLGAALVFGLCFIAGVVLRDVWGTSPGLHVSLESWTFLPAVSGVVLGVLLLHELVHGFLFAAMGGRPRFGGRLISRVLPVVYVTCPVRLGRTQYLIVCLGPPVLLTTVLLAAAVAVRGDGTAVLMLLAAALNAGGSVGDAVMAFAILRQGRDTVFVDTEDGFEWS